MNSRSASTPCGTMSATLVASSKRGPGSPQSCRRFPLAAAVTPGEHDRHVDALPSYLPGCRHRGWLSSLEPLVNGLGSSHSVRRPPTARAARHLPGGGVEIEALVAADDGLAEPGEALAKGPVLALQVAAPAHVPPRSEPGCWTPEGAAPPRVARRVAIRVARQQIQAGYTRVSTAPVCL